MDPLSGFFTAEPGDNLCGSFGHGMDRNRRREFIEEGPPAVTNLRRVGAINPMTDFSYRKRTEDDRNFPDLL
jgi:hypothetical protein